MAKKTNNPKPKSSRKTVLFPKTRLFKQPPFWPGKNIGSLFQIGFIIFIPILITFYLIWPLTETKTQFQTAQQSLTQDPDNLEARLLLIEELLKNNQVETAKTELEKIQNFQLFNENGYRTVNKIENLAEKGKILDPQTIARLIDQWEKIISLKPDYRDGYLQLAVYYYRLSEDKKALENLNKALEIDPNFQPAKELKIVLD